MDYLREYARMCEHHSSCAVCPLHEINSSWVNCQAALYSNTNEAKKIIAKWAEEHPEKTRLQDFLDKYPNARIMKSGDPCACCANLGYIEECPGIDFCKECWGKPLEE